MKLNLLEKKEMNEVRGGSSSCTPNPDCPYNCQTAKAIDVYIERWRMSQAKYVSRSASINRGPADM